jgi:hypothetical protein
LAWLINEIAHFILSCASNPQLEAHAAIDSVAMPFRAWMFSWVKST